MPTLKKKVGMFARRSAPAESAAEPQRTVRPSDMTSRALFHDPDDLDAFFKNNRPVSTAMKRTPVLYLMAGEPKNILIRPPKKGEPPKALFGITLHRIYTQGKPEQWIPCSRAIGSCALCDAGDTAFPYSVFEVVDLTGFKTKKGELVCGFSAYYILNDTRTAALTKALRRVGPDECCVIEAERFGTGSKTTHAYDLVEKAPVREQESLARKFCKSLDWSNVKDLKSQDALNEYWSIRSDEDMETLAHVVESKRNESFGYAKDE